MHKPFRTLWRSRARHGSRKHFYFHGVPASAKVYGKSCGKILWYLSRAKSSGQVKDVFQSRPNVMSTGNQTRRLTSKATIMELKLSMFAKRLPFFSDAITRSRTGPSHTDVILIKYIYHKMTKSGPKSADIIEALAMYEANQKLLTSLSRFKYCFPQV